MLPPKKTTSQENDVREVKYALLYTITERKVEGIAEKNQISLVISKLKAQPNTTWPRTKNCDHVKVYR